MTDREFLQALEGQIHAQLNPPVDCVLGEETIISETPLEECRPDGTQRVAVSWEREIETEPANGGAPCGPTSGIREEVRTCVYVPPSPPPPTGGQHAYFDALAARPDCFAAYSLRDAAWIAARRNQLKTPPQLTYEYPSDPDPRKQDAMKLVLREPDTGLAGTFGVPVGPTNGQHLLVSHDVWYGAEWALSDVQQIRMHKEAPLSFAAQGIGNLVGMRTSFLLAVQHPENQPPGGPYVLFLVPHCLGKSRVVPGYPVTWMAAQAPTLADTARFPTDAPTTQQRDYGNEAICPMAAECGIVAERWTRLWYYFARTPAADWDPQVTAFPGLWSAYQYSVWAADTVRDPVCLLNDVIVGVPASQPRQIVSCRCSLGPPNGTIVPPGRGDLVQYHRNWVVLHGTSKAEVLALLQKPE